MCTFYKPFILNLISASVRQLLEKGGFYDKLDRGILCLSIHDAVVMALERDPDLLHEVCFTNFILSIRIKFIWCK